MLRRFALIASIFTIVASFALVNPASAARSPVYEGSGSVSWGSGHVLSATALLILSNGIGQTAAFGGMALDVNPAGMITGGTAVFAPPGTTIPATVNVVSGWVGPGRLSFLGRVGRTYLILTALVASLTVAAINSSSTFSGNASFFLWFLSQLST